MNNIKVLFDQNESEESLEGGGVMSYTNWERFLPYLNQVFAVKNNEYIIGIKIDKKGITAKFGRK